MSIHCLRIEPLALQIYSVSSGSRLSPDPLKPIGTKSASSLDEYYTVLLTDATTGLAPEGLFVFAIVDLMGVRRP